ncbi:hypothetical protein [Dyadobacter chenhuakuii]|uniref:Uncharacterized protein n=1 Tax=Dyadobacter chenhuakuii TaxID=2909339 RepID=A0ABY4XNF5_9BACT|nr:hypothetical protein [Dyadobacter chenhuakuii]MCF2494694.1 hypothetical protein [Dyadobacter chenhuakuii]USJ31984.1 hypothetical protein NFI80_04435 [Dyadobacter chenhuakuii]
MSEKGSIGVIIGNRDFFPDRLVAEARVEIIDLLAKLKINSIMLDTEDTKLGGVETSPG